MYLSEEQLLKSKHFLNSILAKKPDVGVAILNFNSTEHTLQCMTNIVKSRKTADISTLIVLLENGSRASQVSLLENKIKSTVSKPLLHKCKAFDLSLEVINYRSGNAKQPILYLKTSKNLGFCTGYNLIARIVHLLGTQYFLVFNNDARIIYEDIKQMLSTASQTQTTATSPVILDIEGKIWYAGGRYYPFGYAYLKEPQSNINVFNTDVYSGCCVLFHLPTYIMLKGMRDALFISLDEPDLSRRIKKAGKRIVVAPTIRITHEVGGTIGQKGGRMHNYYWVRNRFYYSQYHNSAIVHVYFTIAYSFARILRWISYLKNKQKGLVKLDMLAVLDYYRNRKGPGSLWKENNSIPPRYWEWN